MISNRQWVHGGYGCVDRGQSWSDRMACRRKQKGAEVDWHRIVLARLGWLLTGPVVASGQGERRRTYSVVGSGQWQGSQSEAARRRSVC